MYRCVYIYTHTKGHLTATCKNKKSSIFCSCLPGSHYHKSFTKVILPNYLKIKRDEFPSNVCSSGPQQSQGWKGPWETL